MRQCHEFAIIVFHMCVLAWGFILCIVEVWGISIFKPLLYFYRYCVFKIKTFNSNVLFYINIFIIYILTQV